MPCRSNNTSKQSYGWRPPAHPLTGLVYCSDCGGKLYCHRYDNGKLKGKFACGNYPQKECASAHRIDADDLLTLVSKTLKSVYDFIQVDNSEFIKAVEETMASRQDQDVRAEHAGNIFRVQDSSCFFHDSDSYSILRKSIPHLCLCRSASVHRHRQRETARSTPR